jgi:hypothetical protein
MALPRACFAIALGFAALLGAREAFATPSHDGCTGYIEEEPDGDYRLGQAIESPGTWCLRRDLLVDRPYFGYAIVRVNGVADVTIDCRGHRIVGTNHAHVAIEAVESPRLVVRNCVFENLIGGVQTYTDAGVADTLVEDNVFRGVQMAINVNTYRSVVRRNRIFDAWALAIVATDASEVSDNVMDGVGGGYYGYAVRIRYANGTRVYRNLVRGIAHSDIPYNDKVKVFAHEGEGFVDFRENVIVGHDGADYDTAFDTIGGPCRLTDNIVIGVEMLGACTVGEDNDISP